MENKKSYKVSLIWGIVCLIFTILFSLACLLCYVIPYLTIIGSLLFYICIPIIVVVLFILNFFKLADFATSLLEQLSEIHFWIANFDYCGLILPWTSGFLVLFGVAGIILDAISMRKYKKTGLGILIATSVIFVLGVGISVIGLVQRF